MKEVTLEQVKEHFKYAKEVRCLDDGKVYDITKADKRGFHIYDNDWWFADTDKSRDCVVVNKSNQFAPIISYIFERGEEVEVSDNGKNFESINFFVGLTKNGNIVGETTNGRIIRWNFARKLSPETQLQPQIDALTEEAKKLGIEITFKILK
jgi:hypothetical protein